MPLTLLYINNSTSTIILYYLSVTFDNCDISKGYTQEELNTAKGNVDLTNPKIANKINQEQKIESKTNTLE